MTYAELAFIKAEAAARSVGGFTFNTRVWWDKP
jgi:hypothetical protein